MSGHPLQARARDRATAGSLERASASRSADEPRADVAGQVALAKVYGELRALAGRYLRRERPGHTLDPTGLVHEVYLRLARGRTPDVSDRAHLIGLAARSMRQVLVNHAERRAALRRGGGHRRVELSPAVAIFEERCTDLVALDEALGRLEARDARLGHVVELRFFGGLGIQEIATVTGSSIRTVERDWTAARAWLRKELAR